MHAGWAPQVRSSPSTWIEQNRELPADSAERGRYSFSRVPYMREIVDTIAEPHVEEVVVLKSARIGFSTAVHSLLPYWSTTDPDPAMLVMPNREAAEDVIKHSLRPMFRELETASDKRGDDKVSELVLRNGMRITIGYSGSEQSLSSRNIRYLILDETDRYLNPQAVQWARARTRTFRYRRRHLIGSTPSNQDGTIAREWEQCGDRRRFHVPCPHCGRYQNLQWHPGLTWENPDKLEDDVKLATQLLAHPERVFYRCTHCQERIGERHKHAMIERGLWVSETQSVDASGNLVGERPLARKVGFAINAIYSLLVSWVEIVVEFLRAKGNHELLVAFYNLTLGEVFVERAEEVRASDFEALRVGASPPKVLPAWGTHLLCLTDTQDDRLIWLIRAFGPGQRSQLVDHGVTGSLDDLRRVAFEVRYPLANSPQRSAACQWLAIDSGGHRTNEIYQFAESDPRIVCVRGFGNPKTAPFREAESVEKKYKLFIVNVHYYKHRLAHYRKQAGQWLLNTAADDRYCQQLAAEQMSWSAKYETWVWEAGNRPNHYHDCETYALFLADWLNIPIVKPPEAVAGHGTDLAGAAHAGNAAGAGGGPPPLPMQPTHQPGRENATPWLSRQKHWALNVRGNR